MSHQAHPQRSKSRSEAKGTCESARRRVGREADDLSRTRLCLVTRRGGNILFAAFAPEGRSLRVHPSSYCAPFFSSSVLRKRGRYYPPLATPEGRAFEYTRSRIAPLFSSGVLRKRGRYPHPLRERADPKGRPQRSKSIDLRLPEGRSLRVHPLSYCAPFFLAGWTLKADNLS